MVTTIVSVSVEVPSLTTTSKVAVVPPCDSLVVHVNSPVTGLITAPAGTAPPPSARLNVRLLTGRSLSLAVAVNVSVLPSSTL